MDRYAPTDPETRLPSDRTTLLYDLNESDCGVTFIASDDDFDESEDAENGTLWRVDTFLTCIEKGKA